MIEIRCRFCGEESGWIDILPGISWYLIHTIRKHWEKVVELKEADTNTIAASIELGKAMGWDKMS